MLYVLYLFIFQYVIFLLHKKGANVEVLCYQSRTVDNFIEIYVLINATMR